jgi:hypothetical protein
MASRELSDRALGMHIGHACEGHVRGILHHLNALEGLRVSRTLPFSFPVNPDVVLLDRANRVKAILIVAYWRNPHNSESKLYRTRLEYTKALEARAEQPDFFASNSVVATIIYGEFDGWKELILSDLEEQCAPLLFVPNVLGNAVSRNLIDTAFRVYRSLWEDGEKQVRELTEKHFAEVPLSNESDLLLQELRLILNGEIGTANKTEVMTPTGIRFPATSSRSRYRQALGILSVFRESEILMWQQTNGSLAHQECIDFTRRALFLNLGNLVERRSLIGTHFCLNLRRPVRVKNGNETYAPDLLDFQDWLRLQPTVVQTILQSHREHTRQPTSVFRGGAFDQCTGNLEDIATELTSNLPQLIVTLRQGNIQAASEILGQARLTTAPTWHPAHESAWMCPLWAFSVCSLALSTNNRGLRSDLKARREDIPSDVEAQSLASRLEQNSEALNILEEILPFLTALLNSQFTSLLNLSQPRLLDLSQPCSWLSDMYNTLTTNSSHNPLNEILRRWVIQLFPEAQWRGWSERRCINVAQVTGSGIGRRQWQLIGIQNKKLIGAEVKSITQNNWGNKSKEIYDRAAELRSSGRELGFETHCILIFDGDLTTDALAELRTGIGHNEVWTIDEVIRELGI